VEKSAEHLEREEAARAAIDRWHTGMPYLGCRRLVVVLAGEGIETNRKEVRRLMREMGIYAVYPGPNLSLRNQKHKVHPYLLRNKVIFLPNQVWALDITYIALRYGHMYLTAIIDWFNINEYNNPKELRRGIASYVEDYNHRRPHQSHEYETPASVYFSVFQRSAAGQMELYVMVLVSFTTPPPGGGVGAKAPTFCQY
jgi:hypothetical protein